MLKNSVETIIQDNKVTYKRYFDVPISLAFEAWSSHEHVSQWWGPDGFTVTTKSMDFSNGGIWDFVMHGPDGRDYKNKIQFTEIRKPHRICYRHLGDGGGTPNEHYRAIIVFEEAGKGTSLTFEQIFSSNTELEKLIKQHGVVEGGKQHIGNLGKYLEKLKNEFKIVRIFDAPRDLVFQAWTDPKCVKQWWGPAQFTSPHCTIDLRVGGEFHFCMKAPSGEEYWNKGVYKEIVKPEKIVTVMYFSDKDGKILPSSHHFGTTDFPSEMIDVVTFEVHEGNKTKLTICRNHSEDIAKKYGEIEGWNTSLDKFAETLTKFIGEY